MKYYVKSMDNCKWIPFNKVGDILFYYTVLNGKVIVKKNVEGWFLGTPHNCLTICDVQSDYIQSWNHHGVYTTMGFKTWDDLSQVCISGEPIMANPHMAELLPHGSVICDSIKVTPDGYCWVKNILYVLELPKPGYEPTAFLSDSLLKGTPLAYVKGDGFPVVYLADKSEFEENYVVTNWIYSKGVIHNTPDEYIWFDGKNIIKLSADTFKATELMIPGFKYKVACVLRNGVMLEGNPTLHPWSKVAQYWIPSGESINVL